MKQVVLCEGKHDVHFVSSFFEKRDGNFEVTEFIGEEVESALPGEESRQIKNFQEPRNPNHVLAKSDNGKQELEKVFATLVNQLLRIHPEIIILVDLDGGSLRNFVDGLDEKIRGRHDRLELGTHEVTKRNIDMLATSCEVVTTNGQTKGEFQIVAFEQTLERVADVSRDEEIDTRRNQIEQFLTDGHAYELLDAALPSRE